MSGNLPSEIQSEIIKRLPVKLLLQFRSVCKAWKSLIDSSHFIKRYSSQHQHLLVRYDYQFNYLLYEPTNASIVDDEPTYVSIVDDETFPHQRVSLTHPALLKMFQFHRIIGSSQGLLCLYASYVDGNDIHGPETEMAFLWNISIRKAIAVVVPNVADSQMYTTFLGFGVCPQTTDPKILKIRHINYMKSIPDSIPRQVEVFALSTGAWRTPYTSNLPRTSIQFGCLMQVVIDGYCYWLATDRSSIEVGFEGYTLIISFHMTREEFREVNLPDGLVYDGSIAHLNISNIRESLVVLEHNEQENVFDVWLMEGGVSKSFAKLFTVYAPNALIYSVLEFRKSGEPVIEIEDDDGDPRDLPSSLVLYDPKSKHISNLGINGTGSFYVHSYVETLLLLDQPEFMIFDKGRRYTAKQRAEIRRLLKHTNRV